MVHKPNYLTVYKKLGLSNDRIQHVGGEGTEVSIPQNDQLGKRMNKATLCGAVVPPLGVLLGT